MIAAEIIAGMKSVTLKKETPLSFLFKKTASNNAKGISTASFPTAKTTVFKSDIQKSGSLLKILIKFASPVKCAAPMPL